MADAQTPVLTDEQIDDWIHTIAVYDIAGPKLLGRERIQKFARAILAAQAPAQPDRAVMQQALDAIAPRFRSGNAVPVDKAVVPAAEWNALVAALSATMEKPNGN